MPYIPTLPDSKPRIFKYSFGYIDRGILTTKIEGPQVLDILDIQEQKYDLVLWAVVDTAYMGAQTTIQIYSAYTGDPPPGNGWSYFKTIQSEVDGLVYHLYLKNDWC
jgi:hypothetical protein